MSKGNKHLWVCRRRKRELSDISCWEVALKVTILMAQRGQGIPVAASIGLVTVFA